jgi:hypothetical protein
MYQQQPYRRDPSTLRGIVQDTTQAQPEPLTSKMGSSLFIAAIGMILGGIVGIVALRNAQHAPPAAAASVPAAIVTPAAPPPVAATATPAPAAPAFGSVTVDGPAGASVFDGDQLVGKAPVTFNTSVGSHAIRVEDAKHTANTTVVVTDKTVAMVHVEFAKHRSRVTSTGIRSPVPSPTASSDSKSTTPSAAEVKAAEDDLRKAKDANSLGGS